MKTNAQYDAAAPLALYTTVHPTARRDLRAWYDSVIRQTDRNFDLWIALDGLSPSDACGAIGAHVDAAWVLGDAGSSPAQVREKAWRQIAERYSAVVLVDCDDVLYPRRVEAAREGLRAADVWGCALRLIDAGGADLGVTLSLPDHVRIDDVLPRCNLFGLSNSAWRTESLLRALPLPAGCRLIDWYLATCSWGHGARLAFDRAVLMCYRRHEANMAALVRPFTAPQIMQAAQLVMEHHEFLRGRAADMIPERRERLERARDRCSVFMAAVGRSRALLEAYVVALNQIDVEVLWWSSVAHPKLESLWKR